MQVIAYAYDADHHCLDCTLDSFPGFNEGNSDEYRDSEGNEIHPLFDTDEWYANDIYEGNSKAVLSCGDCGDTIEEIELDN